MIATIPAAELIRAWEYIQPVAKSKGKRPFMSDACFFLENQSLYLVATDGVRIAIVRLADVEWENGVLGDRWQIPVGSLEYIVSESKKAPKESIVLDLSQRRYESLEWGEPIELWPTYEKILSKNTGLVHVEVKVSGPTLKKALKKRKNTLVIERGEMGHWDLAGVGVSIARSSAMVPMKWSVNPKFLDEAIPHASPVQIGFSDPTGPIRVSHGAYMTVLMPIKPDQADTPSSHNRLAPSDSHRWIKCPGSVCFEESLIGSEKLPAVSVGSEAAWEGTAAHFVCERHVAYLLDGNRGTADIYLGEKVLVDISGTDQPTVFAGSGRVDYEHRIYEVDQAMVDGAELYADTIRRILKELGGTNDQLIPEGVIVELEAKTSLAQYGRPDMGGHADCRISQYFGPLYVIDYKYGAQPVDPAGNPQLLMYALDPLLEDSCATEVHMYIVQPRRMTGDKVSAAVLDPEDLDTWAKNTLLPAIAAAEDQTSPLCAGESQCRWCRCAPYCEELQRQAYDLACAEFPMDLDEEGVKEAVGTMPIERVARLLDAKPLIEAALKAASARALATLESGSEVPGYKLVQRRTHRKWKANAEAELQASGIPEGDLYTRKLISPAQVEKLEKGKYKALAKGLCYKPPGGYTLAKDTDKRPEIRAVEDDFKDDLEPMSVEDLF